MRRAPGGVASIQQSQPVIIVLKKDQQSQLYSLESATQLTRSGRGGLVNYSQQQTTLKVGTGKPQIGGVGSGASASLPGTKRPYGQTIDSSSTIDPKLREIIAPQNSTQGRTRRGGETKNEPGQADQLSNAGAGDEDMQDSEAIGAEGEVGVLNEDTQTKADENEQHQLQQDYAKNAFIIPSCSAWFNIDTIHEIEMQSLPEFFCGKFPHKNPATYLDYRNYIIKLYRESPNAYLSATVCRKNLPGDVCSIIRLHAFLEHWGLINFNVEPHLRPIKMQVGPGGNLNPQLIDLAAKGYLKVSEAEALQKQFSKEAGAEILSNPSQSVFLIASKKISILSAQKRPGCNFCGNLCGHYWFGKRPQQNSFSSKEDQVMKQAGESDSLQHALRRLTQTYILCKDCFTEGNYPKILSAFDFEKQTLETALKAANFGFRYKEAMNEEADEDQPVQYVIEWSIEEKSRLIEALETYQNDWEKISQEVFEEIYSPEECAMQFLSLPISETLLLRFQTAVTDQNPSSTMREGSLLQTYVPTVFQDMSNPLLSQLAIFTKSLDYLEHHEHLKRHHHKHGQDASGDQQQQDGMMTQQQTQPERRTTRKQQKKKEEKALKGEEGKGDNQIQNSQSHQQPNQGEIYLIPQSKAESCLSKETIFSIVDKTRECARREAKAQRKEIERQLDNAIYLQMRKLEHKAQFMRQFWQAFELERRDIYLAREELMAERVALSVLRSGEVKGTQAETVLSGNEFSTITSTLRPLTAEISVVKTARQADQIMM